MYEHDENKVNNLVGSVVKAHQIKFSEVKNTLNAAYAVYLRKYKKLGLDASS